MQKYDQELFKMAMPCLSAIAGALPPDYVDASINTTAEKLVSVDAQGNFDPKPINTTRYDMLKPDFTSYLTSVTCTTCWSSLSTKFFFSSISLPEKLEHFANKYAEHSHEKWSAEKVRPKMDVNIELKQVMGVVSKIHRQYCAQSLKS